ETLSGLLEGLSDVWAVNYNSPQQTVVAGSNTGMDVFLEKAAAAKVRSSELNVACAFHSPLLKDAESGFRAVLGNYQFSSPKLTVMSNTDAKVYPNTDTAIKERLAEHLVSPVRFTDEVENMHRDGVSVFIEAGPGRVLTALVAEILKGQDIAVIQTERAGVNGLTYILQALAKYVATGRKIRATELFRSRGAVALDINILEGNFKADCHPLFFNSSATNEQTVSKD
ncbi:MAG: acyltransferase domain-containing protein, partial [Coriobacteriales bacterium]|nr:acyltransferase domain-containing protein [Coriobacteriales bacterium]